MFQTLGPLELLIILLIVIALFGAGRIAGVGRALGTSVREFRSEARHGDTDDEDDDAEGSDQDGDTQQAAETSAGASASGSDSPEDSSTETKSGS